MCARVRAHVSVCACTCRLVCVRVRFNVTFDPVIRRASPRSCLFVLHDSGLHAPLRWFGGVLPQLDRIQERRIDLSVHWGSETAHSEYDGFYVEDASKNYTLRFSSFLPTSTAGELNQEIPDSDLNNF